MMPPKRTTITLDDDLVQRLRRDAALKGKSFRELVNEALRRGLGTDARQRLVSARFVVRAKSCGFRPGTDPLKLNQLVDELELADLGAERS